MRALKIVLALMLLTSAMPAFSPIGTASAGSDPQYDEYFSSNDYNLFDIDDDGVDDTIAAMYSIDLEDENGNPCTCDATVFVTVEIYYETTYLGEYTFEHDVTGGQYELHTQFLTAPPGSPAGDYNFQFYLEDEYDNQEDDFELSDLYGSGSSVEYPNIVEIDSNWEFVPYDNRELGGYVNALDTTMYVMTGDTVVWAHNTGYTHTAKSDDGTTFDSGNMGNGDTYEYTFNTAGSYDYTCFFHGNMKGTIVVMEPMVVKLFETNTEYYRAGDFLEFDAVSFGEFMIEEMEDEDEAEWDSVEVNWVASPRYDILPFIGPNGVSVDGETCPLGGDCHASRVSFGINMTARNSDDGRYWVMNMSINSTEYTSYPYDGSEYSVELSAQDMWHGDQSAGEFYRSWGWNNGTEESQSENASTHTSTGGIPTEVRVGDDWRVHVDRWWTDTNEGCEQTAAAGNWGPPQCGTEYDNGTEEVDLVFSAKSQKQVTYLFGNSADPNDSGPTTFDVMEIQEFETCEDCDIHMGGGGPDEFWSSEWGFAVYLPVHSQPPMVAYSLQLFVDTDGDGVPDVDDLCPSTTEGAVVDEFGCTWEQRDADDDGVLNQDDDCSGTTAEMTDVDENGCAWEQRDEDGDGVLNPDDQCPGTNPSNPVYTIPPNTGCSDFQLDSDNDTVSDANDTCPGHDDLIDVDGDGVVDGCDYLIDSDGDGVADADDLCEGFDDSVDLDEDGTPDGCDSLVDSDRDGVGDDWDRCQGHDDSVDVDADGIVDGCDDLIDSDADGVADSFDLCRGHNDSVDVDADGIPDGCDPIIDSDLDNVADADDDCPDTRPVDEVDGKGCSAAQRDTDGDGINDALDQCPVTHPGEHDADGNGCPDDTDADGILDVDDDCPSTVAGTDVDGQGCPPPAPTLLAGVSTTQIIAGSSLLLILVIGVVLVFIIRGKRRPDHLSQEHLFEPEGPARPVDAGPPASMSGNIQNDGYEYLEYPYGSGGWWYRSDQVSEWQEWRD